MKRHLIILILSALLAHTTTAAAADIIRLTGQKQGQDSQVSIKDLQVARTQDKTIVTMNFVLDSLQVPSNRYRAFTPVIRSKDGLSQKRLKTLIVSGRRQNIVFERDGIDPLYAANCDNVRRVNGTLQDYAYTDAVTTEKWFDQADVYIECDLCGCGDQMKNELTMIASLTPPDPLQLVNIADRQPGLGKPTLHLHGTAYINFVVNRWELKPDYMNNSRELRKITDTLDIMVRDQNITVKEIKIHGWASPESPYEHNKMLATNRAQALTQWVAKQYQLPASVFAPAEATPENWEGLRRAVSQMSATALPHKAEILAIIDDETLPPDPKEWRMKIRYPDDYQYLLREVYPGLRRSDYEISFDVKPFTLQQAKEVFKTRPYQLSLREMWDVAHTYETGSNDYNRVMQQAVNTYPDDPVALVNLANVALRQRDVLKAETLLERAGDTPEANNSRAVLCILKQQYAQAQQWLDKAEAGGLDVTKNRDAIATLTK